MPDETDNTRTPLPPEQKQRHFFFAELCFFCGVFHTDGENENAEF